MAISQINSNSLASGVPSATNITTGTLPSAQLPAGSVLQVVAASYTSVASNSTTSFIDTGLTASITPTKSSSKILILVTQCGLEKSNGNSQNCIDLSLFRGATQLASTGAYGLYQNSTTVITLPSGSIFYLDSPATTSSTTYKTQFKNTLAASAVYVNSGGAPASTIVLMEIAA
jgi:hypothetical protein